MTRFARAYGSKAFKGRAEEQATPWFVMKQQIEESKFQQQNDEDSNESGNGTNSKTLNNVSDTVNGNDTYWEDFGVQSMQKDFMNHEASVNRSSKNIQEDKKSNKNITYAKCKAKPTSTTNSCKNKTSIKTFGNTFMVQSAGSKTDCHSKYGDNKKTSSESVETCEGDEESINLVSVRACKKKSQKRKQIYENYNDKETSSRENVINKDSFSTTSNRRQMINEISKRRKIGDDFKIESNLEGQVKDRSEETKFTDVAAMKVNTDKASMNRFDDQQNFKHDPFFENSRPTKKSGSGFRLSKFQGISVKKEDADRLRKLQNNLKAKGVPWKTISNVLQSERRKAEKTLARGKRVLCFNCRTFGHSLADCPEAEGPSGICFKCGSTEHTSKTCKVVKSDSFKFSRCFICNEEGHISRQCPDNPRGLYPKGGGCRVCGDVTHLKSECPELIEKKEKNTITVGIMNNNALEVLDEESVNTKKVEHVKKNNIIKF